MPIPLELYRSEKMEKKAREIGRAGAWPSNGDLKCKENKNNKKEANFPVRGGKDQQRAKN